ncbi:MAG: hypothetical protein FRX48_06003 [Lasallia pustulata]|uniref:Uncharacterized protein n=1 Tax=Lasallia pustulata TaxID=136370 RepID=A0A5M8PM61_9LECA|nr:MAG: hypothetical protein FRX48_06003 [Lasallia pustulata]
MSSTSRFWSRVRLRRARERLTTQDSHVVCNGTTHILTCSHAVTLNTRACSTSCHRPQFGTKTRHHHRCPICAFEAEEAGLLGEVAFIQNSRNRLEALRSNYLNPLSAQTLEPIEDLLNEQEANLQFSVNRALWLLYIREGESGVRRQQAARELEETETLERRYIQLMRREWYREYTTYEEEMRQSINQLAATGSTLVIERIIIHSENIISSHTINATDAITREGLDLIDLEHSRIRAEFAQERLRYLRSAMAEGEAVAANRSQRDQAAERPRRVAFLNAQIAMREIRLNRQLGLMQIPTAMGAAEQVIGDSGLHDGLRTEMEEWQDEVERLQEEGLGEPGEQDGLWEPGEQDTEPDTEPEEDF